MESQKGPLRRLFFIRGAECVVINSHFLIPTTYISISIETMMNNVSRVPIIRTLSLGDLMEIEEDKNEDEREAEEEMNIHPPSVYLPSQLENEKVDLPF